MTRSDKPLYSKNIRNNLVDAEFERDEARSLAKMLYKIALILANDRGACHHGLREFSELPSRLPKWLTE